jgi:hypothetical protein
VVVTVVLSILNLVGWFLLGVMVTVYALWLIPYLMRKANEFADHRLIEIGEAIEVVGKVEDVVTHDLGSSPEHEVHVELAIAEMRSHVERLHKLRETNIPQYVYMDFFRIKTLYRRKAMLREVDNEIDALLIDIEPLVRQAVIDHPEEFEGQDMDALYSYVAKIKDQDRKRKPADRRYWGAGTD